MDLRAAWAGLPSDRPERRAPPALAADDRRRAGGPALPDGRGKPGTGFALGRSKPFGLFDGLRRFGRLSALLDAEYGSATFVGAHGVAAYEILVSTSGLLARPLGETRAPPARPAGTAAGRTATRSG